MSKKVIVVSAHPDDEILGAGGALIKHRDAGDELAWLIITNVSAEQYGAEFVAKREKEIETVSSQLKARVYQLDYPTMSLNSTDLTSMVPAISKVFTDFEPNHIYVLNRSDAHSDHRIVFDAVAACTKSFRYPYIRDVWMYECISETEFAPALAEKAYVPNAFVDISAQMNEKLELMKVYESEIGEHPFPRSIRNIKALATFRGATAGFEYAESFQIVKHTVD